MIKSVLITGINGFIGTYTADWLKSQGLDVCGIIKKNSKNDNGFRCIPADISGQDFFENMTASDIKCDAIVHLAADLNMKGSEQTVNTNCTGTYNICRLANYWNVKKLIYMSSIPVIGIPQNIPVTEEHPVNPKTLYHITKYTGELIVQQCCNSSVSRNIIRIPSPIGLGMNRSTLLPVILKRCFMNEDILLYGRGLRKQNYIDVRDISQAIVKSLFSIEDGLFNIAGRESITNLDLAKRCLEITDSDSQIVFNGMPDNEESCIWDISIEKAERILGYSPRFTLEESIRWIYQGMRQEGL